MKTPQIRNISPEQKADAARLYALFQKQDRISRAKKYSQEEFGELFDIGKQSQVWQYLHAKQALPLEKAIKFSLGLNVPIAEFSPSLAEQARQLLRGLQEQIDTNEPVKNSTKIPLLTWDQISVMHKDDWSTADWSQCNYIESTLDVSNNAFAVINNNDAMCSPNPSETSISNGMTLICDPDQNINDGDFVIAISKSKARATLKKLDSDGFTQQLKSLNPAYPRLIVDDDIVLIARVINASINL